MTKDTPAPGIYEKITFDEYCRWDAINNSSLGPALISAAHYRAYLDEPRTVSDALRFGTLVHAGKLDPKDLLNGYAVMPDFTQNLSKEFSNPKGSKEYKERVAAWTEQNKTKEIVEQVEFDLMAAIVAALDNEPLARDCFSHNGPAEVSMIWEDARTGLLCKGRIDKLDHKKNRFADLKTARSLHDYCKEILNRGYHRQAAFYSDGLYQLTGEKYEPWIVPVEKTPPFAVAAAPVGEQALSVGRSEYRQALQLIKDCKRTGNYPSVPSPSEWTLPEWAIPKLTLTGASGPITL